MDRHVTNRLSRCVGLTVVCNLDSTICGSRDGDIECRSGVGGPSVAIKNIVCSCTPIARKIIQISAYCI